MIEHIQPKDLLSSKSASKESISQNNQKYFSMSVKTEEGRAKFWGSSRINPENYGLYSNDGRQDQANADLEDFYSK